MQRFTQLFLEIDRTNRTGEKVAALRRYFEAATDPDAAWALFFLMGKRLRAPCTTAQLKRWAAECSGYPEWLVEVCHARVGDLAETLALLVGTAGVKLDDRGRGLAGWVEEIVQPLREFPEIEKREKLLQAWRSLPAEACLVFNKLLTGAFRMGVQRRLVLRALGEARGLDPAVLEHRLMGNWRPSAAGFRELCRSGGRSDDPERPFPFFLASSLEERSTPRSGGREAPDLPALLGARSEWQVEWKYDGVRAQVIRRAGTVFIWSRGDAIITGSFPEIAEAAAILPDGTVLDGEIVVWKGNRPGTFSELQGRLGRKKGSAAMARRFPCVLLAFDCLEWKGEDIRAFPLSRRRQELEQILKTARESGEGMDRTLRGTQLELPGLGRDSDGVPEGAGSGFPLRAAPLVEAPDWAELAGLREQARSRGVEGYMVKRRQSTYGVGRTRGDWWKWKVEPYTIDAVLVYAQAGHGRRAGLDTDFTFAVWKDRARSELVALCRAYSGLTDAEFRQVNRWMQAHTLDRRGPVRKVEPLLVFEIAFEGIRRSSRHKSGFALRFPRIARWRQDKAAADVDDLETVQALAIPGD